MLNFNYKYFEKIKSDNRGATIIIAMGIAVLTMLAAISLAHQIQANKFNIVAFKDKSQAQVYADNVMSELISEMKNHEAGYNIDEAACANIAPSMAAGHPVTGLTIKCSVIGRSPQVTGIGSYTPGTVYIAPAPGTGNAGGDNCTPLKPQGTGTPAINLDDSCNWGKLAFGNSYTSRVVMPLYYDNGEPGGNCVEEMTEEGDIHYICNPSGNGMSKLIVRVRTPCADGSKTAGCTRYVLKPGTSVVPRDEDPTLVNWEISGDCSGRYCSLIPLIKTKENKTRESFNSEIYGSLINTKAVSANGVVLDASVNYGEDVNKNFSFPIPFGQPIPYISSFLKNLAPWSSQTLSKPVLNLSLIAKKLETTDGKQFSNLEYQILSDKPIANNSNIYYVFVTYNNQGFKIVKSVEQEKNLVDYAVQN